jgi:hypothetical protein
MNESKNQQKLLPEVTVPEYIKENLLTIEDVENNVLVFDSGDCNSLPIQPPDGFNWCHISVLEDNCVIPIDETNPHHGLTIGPILNCHAFIRMPRYQSLHILGKCGMTHISNALLACETLKKKHLLRSNGKTIFGDYGKEIMYTCAGVQVSQNSRQVLEAAPFMDKLPLCHWRVMMKMMQCAEYAFEAISDHQVISNVHHAKRLVPFKTMKIPSCNDYTPLKYYGGIGYGCNVFL